MNVDLDDIGPVTYDRMALIQRIYRMRYFILFGRPVTIEFDSQKRLDLGNSV
jgi:L-fucose isomerase-like protein